MTTVDNKKIKTWQAFLRTHATVLYQLAQEMQDELNLPLTWYDVLIHLNCEPRGGHRLQDLAQAVVLSQSGLTRLLDRMEKEGLVERRPCPYDRRGIHAVITPQGRAVLEKARPFHLRGIENHFLDHLDEADIEALHTAFKKVLQAEMDR